MLWKKRLLVSLGALVLAVLLLGAAYLGIVLHWSYSEGERAGYVLKLSKKGWLCKTWEGELAMVALPGSAPIIFPFTVRDDATAQAINARVGRMVALTYEQHRGIPTSCFGDTAYFVTQVREVTGAGMTGTMIVPPKP
jgi:hypothetical protein